MKLLNQILNKISSKQFNQVHTSLGTLSIIASSLGTDEDILNSFCVLAFDEVPNRNFSLKEYISRKADAKQGLNLVEKHLIAKEVSKYLKDASAFYDAELKNHVKVESNFKQPTDAFLVKIAKFGDTAVIGNKYHLVNPLTNKITAEYVEGVFTKEAAPTVPFADSNNEIIYENADYVITLTTVPTIPENVGDTAAFYTIKSNLGKGTRGGIVAQCVVVVNNTGYALQGLKRYPEELEPSKLSEDTLMEAYSIVQKDYSYRAAEADKSVNASAKVTAKVDFDKLLKNKWFKDADDLENTIKSFVAGGKVLEDDADGFTIEALEEDGKHTYKVYLIGNGGPSEEVRVEKVEELTAQEEKPVEKKADEEKLQPGEQWATDEDMNHLMGWDVVEGNDYYQIYKHFEKNTYKIWDIDKKDWYDGQEIADLPTAEKEIENLAEGLPEKTSEEKPAVEKKADEDDITSDDNGDEKAQAVSQVTGEAAELIEWTTYGLPTYKSGNEEYAVASDEKEIYNAVVEEVESILDDVGYDAFNWDNMGGIEKFLTTDWFAEAKKESDDYYKSENPDEEFTPSDEDPVEWFINNFGKDAIKDLIKEKKIKFDTHAIADEVLNLDGAGHVLSGYDGNEVEQQVNGKTYFLYRQAKKNGGKVEKTAEEKIDFEKDLMEAGESKGEKDKVNETQLAMGKEVEKEHTTNPEIAEKITRDHLAEIPDYYTHLKEMEDNAKTNDAVKSSYAPFVTVDATKKEEIKIYSGDHFIGICKNIQAAFEKVAGDKNILREEEINGNHLLGYEIDKYYFIDVTKKDGEKYTIPCGMIPFQLDKDFEKAKEKMRLEENQVEKKAEEDNEYHVEIYTKLDADENPEGFDAERYDHNYFKTLEEAKAWAEKLTNKKNHYYEISLNDEVIETSENDINKKADQELKQFDMKQELDGQKEFEKQDDFSQVSVPEEKEDTSEVTETMEAKPEETKGESFSASEFGNNMAYIQQNNPDAFKSIMDNLKQLMVGDQQKIYNFLENWASHNFQDFTAMTREDPTYARHSQYQEQLKNNVLPKLKEMSEYKQAMEEKVSAEKGKVEASVREYDYDSSDPEDEDLYNHNGEDEGEED